MDKERSYAFTPCEEGDLDKIEEALRRHSDSFAPPIEGVEESQIVLKVLDPQGVIIAGCTASVDSWGVLNVDDLWVSKRYRHKGIGSKLVEQIERIGRERGCYLSLLGTFDFQAPEFYEKLGYTLFNIWEDYPIGHANYSFYKRLDQAAHEESPLPYWIEVGEEEDGEFISDQLAAYNASRVPIAHGRLPFDRKITDEEGNLVGGYAGGNSKRDAAMLDMLWVDEAYRGQGIGTALLEAAEREAINLGAYVMFVGAFDWQVGFFRRRGYAVTGELQDCPKGHTYYSLEKRL
ncbi:MAG: GNAT family N-acetyltransferase [Clostridia bacterium]|nr:GNAT family N-acetyltransferase [Clostridia bacterium]